jgi:hypothetical protein
MQNLNCHNFTERKRECVCDREREGGGDIFLRQVEYVIGFFYKLHVF